MRVGYADCVCQLQFREGIRRCPGCLRAPGKIHLLLGISREMTEGPLLVRYQLSFDSHIDLTFTYFNGHNANASIPLQRNLNNCFAYDLVPSVQVLSAALKAARRVNDFPTAVRVFEGMRESLQQSCQLRPITNTSCIGIKAKVESQDQYKQYLEELEGLRQELGVALREELYPQEE